MIQVARAGFAVMNIVYERRALGVASIRAM